MCIYAFFAWFPFENSAGAQQIEQIKVQL